MFTGDEVKDLCRPLKFFHSNHGKNLPLLSFFGQRENFRVEQYYTGRRVVVVNISTTVMTLYVMKCVAVFSVLGSLLLCAM